MLSRFSRVQLFATLWTVASQAPLSMGFSRQEYWSGLPCSPPGDLPNPGTKSASLMSPALAGRFFTTRATWEASSTLDLLPNGTNVVINMNSGSWALLCCITVPMASHQSILPVVQGRAAMVSSSQTGILRPRDFK